MYRRKIPELRKFRMKILYSCGRVGVDTNKAQFDINYESVVTPPYTKRKHSRIKTALVWTFML